MRLFIAITLPVQANTNLTRNIEQLSAFLTSGNIVPQDNLHITLHFLGETPDSKLIYIQSAMDSLKGMEKPMLGISGITAFRSADLICARYKHNNALIEVHKKLGDGLEQAGFFVEDRAYRPHTTLIRKARFSLPFSEVNKNVTVYNKPFEAGCITLYRTLFEQDGVKYVPLYSVEL